MDESPGGAAAGSGLAGLGDLAAFLAVARAGGFREASRQVGSSASGLSEAVRRLEARLGVRLLHRSTRSIAPTEAGARLMDRLGPALGEVDAALDVVNGFRDRPAGTLRLNVPASAARLVLPALVPDFLKAYPEVKLEVAVEENFVDVLAAGADAGIRYEERLEQDMIAIPIGPRTQRIATSAAPAYLAAHAAPKHPRDLLQHACLRGRFPSGALHAWTFERGKDVVTVEPDGPLIVRLGGGVDLAIDAALAGCGVIHIFEDWVQPHLASGALVPLLPDWWQSFSGPFLYYPGRRHLPGPLRAFVAFVKERQEAERTVKRRATPR